MTIAGKHSVAEVRDLINAVNYRANAIEQAWEAYGLQWLPTNARDAWAADWLAWRNRYDQTGARRKIILLQAIKPAVPASWIEAETVWQDVQHAITRSGQGDYVTGDLPDVQGRLEAALAQMNAPPLDLSHPPVGTAADVDLIAYKAVDGTVHPAVELGDAIADTASAAIHSNPAKMLFGGILLAGGLYFAATTAPLWAPRLARAFK